MDELTPADDAALVRRAAAGDADSFRAIVVRHQGALFAMLRDLLPGQADREDVAQDAFVAAWTHLGSFDPSRGAFFPWLVRIARNRAINVRKRRAPTPVADVPDRPAPPTRGDAVTRDEAHRRLD